jgi:hypothetical protein
MTATIDQPAPAGPVGSTAVNSLRPVNARGEDVFLTAEGYTLTARQLVHCLAAHLARFGDTLAVQIVDPLCAIDAHMRFDGDLTGWTLGRTPTDVATILARAETVARDYFGTGFPAIPW